MRVNRITVATSCVRESLLHRRPWRRRRAEAGGPRSIVFAPEGRAPRAGVDVREVIVVPELKPHDLRHGVAVEMYGEHGDLEKVRALLGHQRIDKER